MDRRDTQKAGGKQRDRHRSRTHAPGNPNPLGPVPEKKTG